MTQATAGHDRGTHAHAHGDGRGHRHDHGHAHGHAQDHAPGHAPGHAHGHSHVLGHHHHHAPPDGFDRAFAIGAALNLGFVLAEAGFGFAANSVALLADAAHNLGDVLGLLLAWGAAWLARRRPTRERTYGYGRGTILASLANAVVLLVGVGAILVEAAQRLAAPGEAAVGGRTVMLVAAAGIVVNGLTALMFARGRHDDLNVRGAFLHMAADAAVSAGVVVSGALVLLLGWWWIDPLVSVGIAVLILVSTWGLLRSSLDLAMDKVPEGVDPDAVRGYLAGLPGVSEVHDLHVWGLSTTRSALTAHLVHAGGSTDALLREASDGVCARYGIAHATFQVETPGGAQSCALRPACCG